MEPRVKPVVAFAAIAILAFALTTCSNPIDFIAEVTDAVMVAKDKYLQITAVVPVKNATAVNTWGAIVVEFDRDIDPATVTTETFLLEPYVAWTSSFNSATNTLSVAPGSFDSLTDYTITVTEGIKGTDGSSLRNPYAWSFQTKTAPGGSIQVAPLVGSNVNYTKAVGVLLNISYNGEVYQMRYSDDPSDFDLAVNPGDTGWVAANSSAAFTLLAGDGTKTVYIQFKDLSNNRTPPMFAGDTTTPISDTIILDTDPPDASVGTYPSFLNIASPSVVPGATASDENGVTCSWTQVAGTFGAVTFSSSTDVNPTITGALVNSTTGVQVRLRATDPAGNYTDRTSTAMTVDRVAPTAPSVTGPGNSSTDITPTFNWVGGGGGSGTFQYRLDSSAWSADTIETTYSPSCSYGGHDFYVWERDTAGNWSPVGSDDVFIYPTYLSPAQYTTVDRSPHVQWWDPTASYTFNVYYRPRGDKIFTRIGPTTAYFIDLPMATLAASTIYEWYYTRTSLGRTYRYPPSTVEYFEFKTNAFK